MIAKRPPLRSRGSGSEFELIDAIKAMAAASGGRHRHLKVGIGDDAAVVSGGRDSVISTDTLVEGVHFKRDWLSFSALGKRAFRCAVSDLAAMGAAPQFVFLSLNLPDDCFSTAAISIARGLIAAADEAGVVLAGGNISRAGELSITVTITGAAPPRLPTRNKARRDDLVFVSGWPGLCALGLRRLGSGERSGKAVGVWRCPPLRIELGRRLAKLKDLGAMIDISDSLVQDIGHVARASGKRIELELDLLPIATVLSRQAGSTSAIRRLILGGGEDYELAFTIKPRSRVSVAALAARLNIPLTRIGVVKSGPASVTDQRGCDIESASGGYDHGRNGTLATKKASR